MSDDVELWWDGDDAAKATVLLAHGAGAGSSSQFQRDVAAGLALRGLRVARFDFAYMAEAAHGGRRRAPDPAPKLLQRLRAAAAATGAPPSRLVLAGKSMGGRMATMLADELGAAAVLAFGYPFHPPKQRERLRTTHLAALRTPCLIVQGERDPFGTRTEVEGYALSAAIELHWIADGDHSLQPRRSSGIDPVHAFAAALDRAAAFALQHAHP